jgi:hypothetical protein
VANKNNVGIQNEMIKTSMSERDGQEGSAPDGEVAVTGALTSPQTSNIGKESSDST